MINILFMSHFPTLEMGGQKSMLNLIINLDRSIYKPFAIVPEIGELSKELESYNCKTFVVPLKSLKPKHLFTQIHNIYQIKKIIKDNNISIVHPDHERDSIIGGLASKLCKTKLVWHVRLTRKVETDSLSFALADKVIGISDDVRLRFNNFKNLNKKYTTVYNGVDTELFRPLEKREAKSNLKLDIDKHLVIFVGQFKPGKGILDIINAVKIYNSNPVNKKNIKFLMLGMATDQDFLSEMTDLIELNRLDSLIELTGFKKNIQMYMQAADVLILPSHEGTEGMGRVIFEAMSCGTAVIGTNTTGIREAVTNHTGLLVPEKSPLDLASAISKLIDNDILRDEFAMNGRKRALEYFDIKNHAEKISEVYQELINQNL